MADWVSNLAPLGQNRVSRHHQSKNACVSIQDYLFYLTDYSWFTKRKENIAKTTSQLGVEPGTFG